MTEQSRNRWHALWIIPPVAVGVLLLILMTSGEQPPVRVAENEIVRAVRTITVPQIDLKPRAEGYGAVQPAQIWKAVAQVSGRIVEIHPKLRDGEILTAGTLLLRIDPVDYELSQAQARAELAELDVQEQNSKDSLVIEQRNLQLARRELSRIKKLTRAGSTSQSSADSAERSMLSSRAAVQNLRNNLALLPTKRKLLQAKLLQTERDLAHTEIRAPFNLRIAGLGIETEQFVSKGQGLFQGDAVDRIEVIAQVPMSSLRNLFIGHQGQVLNTEALSRTLTDYVALQAVIHLDLGNYTATWDAEFVRFSDNVDAATRTIGVVVAVDKPLEKIKPGYRPPLSKGMFVQVTLSGRSQPGRLVIPRTAIHAGKVRLVDADQRLKIQPVERLYSQAGISVIKSGLAAGQQVVVSELVPAVAGMRLLPQPDTQLQRALTGSPDASQ